MLPAARHCSRARLLPIPPAVHFISELIKKIHPWMIVKVGANLCCQLGSLSRISFATSSAVSKVTELFGLCSLLWASQMTHKDVCGAMSWDYCPLY